MVNHCLAGQPIRLGAFLRLCPVISKETTTTTSYTDLKCGSRRNLGLGHVSNSKVEERQRESESDNSKRRQFNISLVSLAVGASTLLSGFIWYHKRKQSGPYNNNVNDVFFQSPFSTVHAADVVIDDNSTSSSNLPPSSSSLPSSSSNLPPSRRFNFIADVVEKTAPGVVYIEIKERLEFINKIVTVSNGSGFIVRADGLIVTNAHVVANKNVVTIKLFDGRQVEGQVVAVDPVSDLACIKINVPGLSALKMGKSANLRSGEWVVAMGSPLSLSNTVTSGIVSSVSRRSQDLGLRNKDMDYIQTDALINYGNSGGPLVNLDGEVIGINTMKVTPGISFAIPSDYVSGFLYKVEEVLRTGKPGVPQKRQWFTAGDTTDRKRFIGITMLTLSTQLLMDLKTRVINFPDITGGVLVHKIVMASPAFTGGLRAGDIIVEINGEPIQAAADVYKMVESSESLSVTVFRGGTKQTFTVKPEEVS